MKSRRTIHSNHVLSLKGGNEDNDLWAVRAVADDGAPVLCSTWEPTDEERERIAAGENIELIVWGLGQPPVAMRLTDVPLGKSISKPEVAERLRKYGHDDLAKLLEEKSVEEFMAEVKSWGLPDELRDEVLTLANCLDDEEWPYPDDPPDPL